MQAHRHELASHVPIYGIRRGPSARISRQRQGVQCHEPVQLRGYNLVVRRDQFLLETGVGLLNSEHQPLEYAQCQVGFIVWSHVFSLVTYSIPELIMHSI